MGAQTTYYGGALVAKQDNLVKVDMPALMPVAQLPNPLDTSERPSSRVPPQVAILSKTQLQKKQSWGNEHPVRATGTRAGRPARAVVI